MHFKCGRVSTAGRQFIVYRRIHDFFNCYIFIVKTVVNYNYRGNRQTTVNKTSSENVMSQDRFI